MVHGKYRIKFSLVMSSKKSVCAVRTNNKQVVLFCFFDGRLDRRVFLLAQQTFIPGMRVKAQHSDPGLFYAKIFLQTLVKNFQFTKNSFLCYLCGHFAE